MYVVSFVESLDARWCELHAPAVSHSRKEPNSLRVFWIQSFSYKRGFMNVSASGLLSGSTLFNSVLIDGHCICHWSQLRRSMRPCCSAVPSPVFFRHWLNKSSRQSWRVTVSFHFQHTYSNIVTFVAVIRQLSFHVLAKVHRLMKRRGQKWQTTIVHLNFNVGDGRCEGVDWMDLSQDRDRWRALVNAVMNLRVP
jgi:hypothetical protein